MSPVLAHLGSAGERGAFPVLGVKRTSRVVAATAALDPGRVKTPTPAARVETSRGYFAS
jgi:hypothetical protein